MRKRWFPVIFWCLLIFLGSSLPSARVSENFAVDFITHKSVHLIEYGVLAILVFRGSHNFFWAFVFSFLYGILDETHQLFILGRQGKVSDAFFDGGSAALALYLLWKSKPNLPKKLKDWLLI